MQCPSGFLKIFAVRFRSIGTYCLCWCSSAVRVENVYGMCGSLVRLFCLLFWCPWGLFLSLCGVLLFGFVLPSLFSLTHSPNPLNAYAISSLSVVVVWVVVGVVVGVVSVVDVAVFIKGLALIATIAMRITVGVMNVMSRPLG